MPLDVILTRQHLKAFNFISLFIEELGWDHHTTQLDVTVDGESFPLTSIARKRGFIVFLCSPSEKGFIPDYPTRRKIERQIAKSFYEHLIIFPDRDRSTQLWQWVKREIGKPAQCREHTYFLNQPGDSLIQKLQGILFTLDEEEAVTHPDVTSRVRASFDIERVTKRFYDRFKSEHDTFLKFLKGIPNEGMQR